MQQPSKFQSKITQIYQFTVTTHMKNPQFVRISSPPCKQTYSRLHYLANPPLSNSQKLQKYIYVDYCPIINSNATIGKGRRRTNYHPSLKDNTTIFEEIKSQKENYFRSSQKRNTLQQHSFGEIQTSIHQILIPSTTNIPKSPRVNFTYNPAHQQGSTQISLSSPTSLLLCPPTLQKPLRSQKQLRNSLSNQFQFYFHPQEVKRQVQTTGSIQRSLKFSRNDRHYQSLCLLSNLKNSTQNTSKVASTQATQSMVLDQKNNSLAITQYFNQFNQKQSTYGLINQNYIQNNNSQLNLLARIPSSKRLDKTIILNSKSCQYDFGGILNNHKQMQKLTVQQQKIERDQTTKQMKERKWSNNMKCLLVDEQNLNLKESIHCGPDTLLQRFKCQLLDHFGRDIKQSYMPYE